MLELLPHDLYPVVFRTKRYDDVLDRGTKGFQVMTKWEAHDPDVSNRISFWPPLRKGVDSLPDQRVHFKDALDSIFRQGGYTLYLDELRFITDTQKLGNEVELLLMQGHSLGVGVWSAVQRPRHVPLTAYDQAGHLFFWHNADLQTHDRLGEVCGGAIEPHIVEDGMLTLDGYEFLYVDTRRKTIVKSEVEL